MEKIRPKITSPKTDVRGGVSPIKKSRYPDPQVWLKPAPAKIQYLDDRGAIFHRTLTCVCASREKFKSY